MRPSVKALLETKRVGRSIAPSPTPASPDRSARQARRGHLIRELRAQVSEVAAYGAAAKGSTLLNTFEIGGETLDFVADRSTHKQGRYMPGVRVPIVSPARLLEARPDYTLLLTWNFADEILEQQAEYRRLGGKFIVPVPRVKVI